MCALSTKIEASNLLSFLGLVLTLICAMRLPLYPCKVLWIKTRSQKPTALTIHPCNNYNLKRKLQYCFKVAVNIQNSVEC